MDHDTRKVHSCSRSTSHGSVSVEMLLADHDIVSLIIEAKGMYLSKIGTHSRVFSAEDVMQELFIKLKNASHILGGLEKHLQLKYATRAAISLYLDNCRRQKKNSIALERLSQTASLNSPSSYSTADSSSAMRNVAEARDCLNSEENKLVEVKLAGGGFTTMNSMFRNKSRGAIRALWSRTVCKLRNRLRLGKDL